MKATPTFFDSHLHVDDFVAAGEFEAVLERARAAGVTGLAAIGGSLEANRLAVELARTHPDTIIAAVGYDRDEAGKSPDLGVLAGLAAEAGVGAVGETGLDYHYTPETAGEQQALFQSMLDLAYAHTLPVVVHSREAEADTLRLLERQAARWPHPARPFAVLHCFTGDAAFAARLVELGVLISFSGILTFRNAAPIREAARVVPDANLLIETDAPYLAPVPHRGKRNEPAYVVRVAEVLARERGASLEQIARLTSRNARRLYDLASGA